MSHYVREVRELLLDSLAEGQMVVQREP